MWSNVYRMSVSQCSEVCSTAVRPESLGTRQHNTVNARLPPRQGCCYRATAGATWVASYIHTTGRRGVLLVLQFIEDCTWGVPQKIEGEQRHSWPAMTSVQAKFRQCQPPPTHLPTIRPGDTGVSVWVFNASSKARTGEPCAYVQCPNDWWTKQDINTKTQRDMHLMQADVVILCICFVPGLQCVCVQVWGFSALPLGCTVSLPV